MNEGDNYVVRNGRKRQRWSGTRTPEPPNTTITDSAACRPQVPTLGWSTGYYETLQQLEVTSHRQSPSNDKEDYEVGNETTWTLQAGETLSGHDALGFSSEAAGLEEYCWRGGNPSLQGPGMGITAGAQHNPASAQADISHLRSSLRTTGKPSADSTAQQPPTPGPPSNLGLADAVRACSKFRFVRGGWLTAKEAIAYIDYFYTHLSPLTPIIVPDYRDYALHTKLLKEEPMLVLTLLVISTGCTQPSGPSGVGARSRAYSIHERLWKCLRAMINRLILGQEQLDGGPCSAGQQSGSESNPLLRSGLRALGSVESLMLLTEWQPRSLQFPPGDGDDELTLPDDPYKMEPRPDLHGAKDDSRIDGWLLTCWRSDRLSWMLLGNAMTLALEIGVFNATCETEVEEAKPHIPRAAVEAYYRRNNHLKDLLVTYVTQTSGRLGLKPMLPQIERNECCVGEAVPLDAHLGRTSRSSVRQPRCGTSSGEQRHLGSGATQERRAVQDRVLDFWQRITKFTEIGGVRLLPCLRKSKELCCSDEYEQTMEFFQDSLVEWRAETDLVPHIPTPIRYVLDIEFEYTRAYLNSLALEAIEDRRSYNTPLRSHTESDGHDGRATCGFDDDSITLQRYTNARYYVNEIVDALCNVLKIVVKGLHPGGYLRLVPVRTFFRIAGVVTILSKTFARNPTEGDAATSLKLLRSSVDVLRSSIVEDGHVGTRLADLMETLTHSIYSRSVCLGVNRSVGSSRAVKQSHTTPPPMSTSTLFSQPDCFAPSSRRGGTSFQDIGADALDSPDLGLTGCHARPSWGIPTDPYGLIPNHIISTLPCVDYTDIRECDKSNILHADHITSWDPWDGSSSNWNADQGQDWELLTLDPLVHQLGADVNHGADTGSMDILNALLTIGGPPGSTS